MKRGRHRLQSVILNRTVYGEADLIVVFFTGEYGKIKGLAKHARKSLKRFGSVLTSVGLAELSFTYNPNRDLVMLEEGELSCAYDHLAQDPEMMGLAGLALELADAFCPPWDPAPGVFDLLLWCLDRLDRDWHPQETMFIFQVRLLGLTGFAPNLAGCGLCGRKPEEGAELALKPDSHGLVCRACSLGGFPVTLGALKSMTLIQSLEPDKLDRVRIDSKTLVQAGPFLMSFIRHLLGRDLRSARFLEQIAKKSKTI